MPSFVRVGDIGKSMTHSILGASCAASLEEVADRPVFGIVHVVAQGSSRRPLVASVELGEGVVVRLPDGLFIESTKDLEAFVGKRASTSIFHPIDGSMLVEKGKIITRSRIMQLENLDVDMARVRAEAAKL